MTTHQKLTLSTAALLGIAVAAFVGPIWINHFLDWIPFWILGTFNSGLLFFPLIVVLGFTARPWMGIPFFYLWFFVYELRTWDRCAICLFEPLQTLLWLLFVCTLNVMIVVLPTVLVITSLRSRRR